ncbi:efflux RND transporter periplasmic adaptor subunit [Peptoclostridium sp. AF21-18]|uniref:efflux RND transporter periplasmic adaptor subunit n=1 Tax=Peptoclostridium sp. AF21-18 TaxID=2292243 RepID=UPI000E53942B|nr:efflux RND transporter periplasmic adaptor subunit [Peptoclostridium sp. AF21-18]RHQ97983.1 efflux RND transporter periplasmic adaptor subunit [Peptoclostridium sp. AF21-18]
MAKIKGFFGKIKNAIISGFKGFGNFIKNHKKGTAVVVVILLAAGFMVGTDYVRRTKEEQKIREKYEIYKIPAYENIDINGMVTPRESKQYANPENNSLSDISVENGQEVNDGDLLFTTKDNSVIEQINVLKSQLTSLNSQKSRLSKNNKDNVNNDAIASINTQISSVEAQISALNSSAYVKNTAPFAGKVYINDQNSTDMSTSFISLVSNEFFMKGYVSEDDLEKVQVDQTVSIKVNSSDKKMTGRISYVSDRPTTAKTKEMKDNLSYYEVDISFEDQEGLVNGFHVDADLEIVSNEYKVPTTAVLKSGDSAYVMKDLDGILKKQEVTIVKTGKNVTKIVTNLEPGDKILKHPDKSMKEGDAIPSAGLVDKSPKIDPEKLKIPDVNGQIEE